MTKLYKNGEEYYNKIYLQFNFFIAISLVPFGYLLLQKQAGLLMPMVDDEFQLMVVSALLLAAAAVIFQVIKSFKEYLAGQEDSQSLREKLDVYKTHSVKKFISFFLASMICVCGFYLTAHSIFIVGYIVSTVLLSIKRPTLNTIIEDLKLSKEEQQILIDKKEIL